MAKHANYKLLEYSLEQLLSDPSSNDRLVYEDDVPTLEGGVLRIMHYEISEAQAKTIMRSIVGDAVIAAATRDGIQKALSNPKGNLPIGGSHPVSPERELIQSRALIPNLGAQPPVDVLGFFCRKAYEYFSTNHSANGDQNDF